MNRLKRRGWESETKGEGEGGIQKEFVYDHSKNKTKKPTNQSSYMVVGRKDGLKFVVVCNYKGQWINAIGE